MTRDRRQTLVTGLWDLESRERIGRRSLEEHQRNARLVLDWPEPMVAFVDPHVADWVVDERERRGLGDRTLVVVRPYEELPYLARATEAAGLANHENCGPYDTVPYDVVGWSKLPLVVEAVDLRAFGTEHFAWIDFGIGHVARTPASLPDATDGFGVLQMRAVAPAELEDEREFFRCERGRIAGGFLRASGTRFREAAVAFDAELDHILGLGIRPLEQMVLSSLSVREPGLFTFHYGDYPSILSNWESIRQDVVVVLDNLEHCRRWGFVEGACAVAAAVVDALERGDLEADRSLLQRAARQIGELADATGRTDLADWTRGWWGRCSPTRHSVLRNLGAPTWLPKIVDEPERPSGGVAEARPL